MRKIILLLLFMMCVTLSACGEKRNETTEEVTESITEASSDSNMNIANPWSDCSSLSDAAKIAGFEMTVPDSVDGYPNVTIQAMKDNMIQVFFSDKDMDADDRSDVLVRKGVGSDDISGDYNEYSQTESAQMSGMNVTLRGNDNKVFNVTWTNDGYSYSIVADKGLDKADIEDIIGAVK
jgi:hypothetical protein